MERYETVKRYPDMLGECDSRNDGLLSLLVGLNAPDGCIRLRHVFVSQVAGCISESELVGGSRY